MSSDPRLKKTALLYEQVKTTFQCLMKKTKHETLKIS
jgi:hypothetical protein